MGDRSDKCDNWQGHSDAYHNGREDGLHGHQDSNHSGYGSQAYADGYDAGRDEADSKK